jgi:hypothetical protein
LGYGFVEPQRARVGRVEELRVVEFITLPPLIINAVFSVVNVLL